MEEQIQAPVSIETSGEGIKRTTQDYFLAALQMSLVFFTGVLFLSEFALILYAYTHGDKMTCDMIRCTFTKDFEGRAGNNLTLSTTRSLTTSTYEQYFINGKEVNAELYEHWTIK